MNFAGTSTLLSRAAFALWAVLVATVGLVPQARRIRLDHFFVTLQAAMDGLGLAIAPFPVLDSDVAAGRFVTPFPTIRVPREPYYALVPHDGDKTRSLRALRLALLLP